MAKVVFYGYDFKKDKDAAIGSFTWDGEKVTAVGDGPRRILANLTETGVKDPLTKKTLFPKDGEKFLAVLKFKFDNLYLRASDVMTGE